MCVEVSSQFRDDKIISKEFSEGASCLWLVRASLRLLRPWGGCGLSIAFLLCFLNAGLRHAVSLLVLISKSCRLHNNAIGAKHSSQEWILENKAVDEHLWPGAI